MNLIRRPYYYLLIVLASLILSCDEKLPNVQNEEVSIVGTWYLNEYSGTSIMSSTEEGMPITIESIYEGLDYDANFTFLKIQI